MSDPEKYRNAVLKVVRLPHKLQNAILKVVRNTQKLPNAFLKVVRHPERFLDGVLWFFAVKQGFCFVFGGVFGESKRHFLNHLISTKIALTFNLAIFNERILFSLYKILLMNH